MTRDPLLRDAVKAIKQKILTGAESASPEELAYLGTAIDRIGGRATVLEVEEIGDIKIAELTEHASQTEAVTMANIAATKMAAEGSSELAKDQAAGNETNAKGCGDISGKPKSRRSYRPDQCPQGDGHQCSSGIQSAGH